MLVLDTRSLPPRERAEAFQATVSGNCSASMASFEDPAAIEAKMTVFDFGRAKVFNIEASGTTLRRTPRIARASDESSIVLALPMRTDNHLMWAREGRVFGPRDLMLVDLSLPYVYGWRGGGPPTHCTSTPITWAFPGMRSTGPRVNCGSVRSTNSYAVTSRT